MYGLKSDIDLSFLNGRELIQVAIGLYQIQFGFDGDVRISVEGEFSYFDGKTRSFGELRRVPRRSRPAL